MKVNVLLKLCFIYSWYPCKFIIKTPEVWSRSAAQQFRSEIDAPPGFTSDAANPHACTAHAGTHLLRSMPPSLPRDTIKWYRISFLGASQRLVITMHYSFFSENSGKETTAFVLEFSFCFEANPEFPRMSSEDHLLCACFPTLRGCATVKCISFTSLCIRQHALLLMLGVLSIAILVSIIFVILTLLEKVKLIVAIVLLQWE